MSSRDPLAPLPNMSTKQALTLLVIGIWVIVAMYTRNLPLLLIPIGALLVIMIVIVLRDFDAYRHPKAMQENQIGLRELRKGDYDSAVVHFEAALKLNPHFSWAYNNRALALAGQNRLGEALADAQHAAEISPKLAPAYTTQAMIYLQQRKFEEALASCDTATRLKPRLAYAHVLRGNIFIRQGDIAGGIAAIKRAVQLKSNYAAAYNDLGLAYMQKDDFDLAIAVFNKAIQLEPQNALMWNNRGYIYLKKGELDKALENCNQALKLNPKLHFAYNSRGEIQFVREWYGAALADFEKAASLKPNDPFNLAAQAVTYFALGQPETAQQLWSNLLALDARYQKAETLASDFHCTTALMEAAHNLTQALRQDDTGEYGN